MGFHSETRALWTQTCLTFESPSPQDRLSKWIIKLKTHLRNLKSQDELTDEDIRKYIDLFIKEEVQNGRGPEDLPLKDTIEVYHSITHYSRFTLATP